MLIFGRVDSIFKLTAAYKADTYPQKVNLGVGAYRDDNSKPWILPVVKTVQASDSIFQNHCFTDWIPQASERLLTDPNVDHEYLPITGLAEFTSAAAKLILGADSAAIKEKRVVSVQTISGTGANHLGAAFLERFYGWGEGGKKIWLSNPTWGVLRESLRFDTA